MTFLGATVAGHAGDAARNKPLWRQHYSDMTGDRVERRRRAMVTFGVLLAGILASALMVVLLVFMGREHPHF
jgi:hypothetical protein